MRVRLLDLKQSKLGGYHTVWRDTRGRRVHVQVAPGANLTLALAAISARLTLNR